MHCQPSLYCCCCLASVTFAAPSAPPTSMHRLLSPDSCASPPVVVTLAACLSRLLIAAARLLRHQRYCRRTVSNADVDAPLLLCIITGRHHSFAPTVHSVSAAYVLLVAGAARRRALLLRHMMRLTRHFNSTLTHVDAPLITTCRSITLYAEHYRLSYYFCLCLRFVHAIFCRY